MAAISVLGNKHPMLQQVQQSPLNFVAAKYPEAVSIKPSTYIVIKPNTTNANSSSYASSGNNIQNQALETRYYGFNESENDRGSREDSRIYKSWRDLKKSPLGLDNSGVTCYMNAAIQALMHIPAMAHYLKDVYNGKHKDIISPTSVTAEMASLYSKLFDGYKKKKSIFPTKIIKRLDDINCMMSEWQQEDSHEYFMSLMGRLQEDSVPKGAKMNSSILYDIFSGKINQKVTCKNCNHVSTTIQEFSDLSVSLKENRKENSSGDSTMFTLKDSIKEFFSPELIKVDSKTKAGYNCEKCKKTSNAVKISTIDDAPEYLTIHLKRFKFQGSKSHKIKEPISYPMDLDISKFSSSGNDPIKYRLIGVIVHAGRTVSSGHYIAMCQQPNGTWAEYDDDFVRKISEKSVLKEESAYMLIYSRLKVKSQFKPKAKEASVSAQKFPGYKPSPMNTLNPAKKRSIEGEIDKIFSGPSRKKKRKSYSSKL